LAASNSTVATTSANKDHSMLLRSYYNWTQVEIIEGRLLRKTLMVLIDYCVELDVNFNLENEPHIFLQR
jgi:hypothetical protein